MKVCLYLRADELIMREKSKKKKEKNTKINRSILDRVGVFLDSEYVDFVTSYLHHHSHWRLVCTIMCRQPGLHETMG